MNTKEISLAVNKTERSVQRWVKKANDKSSSINDKSSSSTSTSPADYNLEETILIIEQGLGKNAADMFRINAGNNIPVTLESVEDNSRLDRIEMMLEKLIMFNSEQVVHQKQIPFVPEIDNRTQIVKIARDHSERTAMPYSSVWNMIYTEMNYTFHKNFRLLAENRNMKPLDYIENKGMIDEMLVVTKRVCE